MKLTRRNIMTEMCQAELAIMKAMDEVEKLEANVKLTIAVTLLMQAKEEVSDFIDGID